MNEYCEKSEVQLGTKSKRVSELLEKRDKLQYDLDEKINCLYERVSYLMRETKIEECVDTETSPVQRQSELSNKIDNQNDRLQTAIYRISFMLENLEV